MTDDPVKVVDSLFQQDGHAPCGYVRVNNSTPGGHPADGMTATVSLGDGAYSSIINPWTSGNSAEWVMRYGNPVTVRYAVARLLESYDYLLSDDISEDEAIRRLRIQRGARSVLSARGAA